MISIRLASQLITAVLAVSIVVEASAHAPQVQQESTDQSPALKEQPRSKEAVPRHTDNAFLPSSIQNSGWPHIRGPNLDGLSPEVDLADQWPATGPPVLWVKELGQGYSSFVVKDDRAYTQYQSLAGQYVICLNASTGKTIWQYRYDWPFESTGLYPGPRSTPTLFEDNVYYSTPLGAVGCLSRDGKLIWQRELKSEFDGKGTDFGYACSPTIVDGKVFMPVGGDGASIVALDAKTGSVIWKSGDASASYTPAFPITVDGHEQIIGYLEHNLVAMDRATGVQLWQQKLSRGYDEHSAWPIYREPYLWTAAPFQAGSQLLKLSSGDAASFERVRQSPDMSNDVSSSVLVDGYLYGSDLAEAQTKAHRPSRGAFRCIDFLTGETMWSNGDAKKRRGTDYAENAAQQLIGHANVIVADNKLILFNDLGDLILAKVDPREYVELARTPALGGEIVWTTPALDRGRLFLRNHSRAVCLYLGDPETLDSAAIEAAMTVADIPQGRVRDLSLFVGVEPEYAMDPPTVHWLINWFWINEAILFLAALFALPIALLRKSKPTIRFAFWAVAMILGVIVGAPASRWSGDFLFTWPVVIFVVFQMAVYQSSIRRSEIAAGSRHQDRAVALLFLAVCAAYYLLCRQLSLVTEWMFLCGFAGAAPFALLGRALKKRTSRYTLAAEFTLTVVAYAAFHLTTAVLLSMKYNLSRY